MDKNNKLHIFLIGWAVISILIVISAIIININGNKNNNSKDTKNTSNNKNINKNKKANTTVADIIKKDLKDDAVIIKSHKNKDGFDIFEILTYDDRKNNNNSIVVYKKDIFGNYSRIVGPVNTLSDKEKDKLPKEIKEDEVINKYTEESNNPDKFVDVINNTLHANYISKNIEYYDNKNWIVMTASVNNIEPSMFILRKNDSIYTLVVGPGTSFTEDVLVSHDIPAWIIKESKIIHEFTE